MKGGLLVCGATSGAGKSTVVAGLGRLLARRGVHVAPFKAQNMSNHSAVTVDGGEVGRAQAVQASACGIDAETAMNPILLKPSSDRASHVVVLGREVGTTDAHAWGASTTELRRTVLTALDGLRARFDVVVAELERRTGVPVLGVLPHLGGEGLLGVEDGLDVGGRSAATRSTDPLRVAAVRLPHLANPSDLDPFAGEPDVDLVWATAPADLASADLVVVPGSRATVADLDWLRATGLADALRRTDADIIGVCAGLQMLGRTITDDLESARGTVAGLGLLPAETSFGTPKVVRRRRGTIDGVGVTGYQIHLGRVSTPGPPFVCFDDSHGMEGDGVADRSGRIRGTTLHGVFDRDAFRRPLLTDLARRRDRDVQPSDVPFATRVATQHDRLADWLEQHLDLDAVEAAIAAAAPPGEGPGWAA